MGPKQQEIAENYLREKRRLNAQRIELFDQLADFRRKTEQLVAQVMYLTQDDIHILQDYMVLFYLLTK